MVTLRKMTEKEFRAFKKYSVADYAEDLIKGQSMSREQALMDAEKEFDRRLPDGLGTADNFLMNIENANGKNVGWIWFQYDMYGDTDTKQVFLADLLIFESERRQGYASAALNEMNTFAMADGCSSSALFVWEHNPGGMSLYEKCGYKPKDRRDGGTFMMKKL